MGRSIADVTFAVGPDAIFDAVLRYDLPANLAVSELMAVGH